MTASVDYYFDNAATTRPYSEVIERVNQCLLEDFGNPSSTHPLGTRARLQLEEARSEISKIFQVPTEGVIFTGSGTESDNLAIKGLFDHKPQSAELVTSRLEHAAVLKTATWLETKGVKVHYVNIDPLSGQVDLDHLATLVDEKTRLVSLHHVNSETGIIQDLGAISGVIRDQNSKCLFHSDGVQAFTKFPVNLKGSGVDLYSISAHKFHGVKGAGALIFGRKVLLEALIHGGGQENGFRSGTESVPLIAGMGLAAKTACEWMDENNNKVAQFAQAFQVRLKERIPKIRMIESENKVPHIQSLAVPGIPGEVLMNHLGQQRIHVSTGSACHASSKQLSPTLTALRFPPDRIKETIRVSLDALELPKDPEPFLDLFVKIILDLM